MMAISASMLKPQIFKYCFSAPKLFFFSPIRIRTIDIGTSNMLGMMARNPNAYSAKCIICMIVWVII
jgi:hypothetical protein